MGKKNWIIELIVCVGVFVFCGAVVTFCTGETFFSIVGLVVGIVVQTFLWIHEEDEEMAQKGVAEGQSIEKTAPRRINKRKIGVCILLSIITFGIYSIYWEYLLIKNIRTIQKDESSCTGEMLCLLFVPCYSLFWWFTRGKIVKNKFAEYGYSATGNETIYLVLTIFGFAIISMAIMQDDFNSLSFEATQSNW